MSRLPFSIALRVLLVAAVSAPAASALAQGPVRVRVTKETAPIYRSCCAPVGVIQDVYFGTALDVLRFDNNEWVWVVTPPDGYGVRRGGWMRAGDIERLVTPTVATIGGNGNDGAGGAGAGANGSVPEDRVTITARRADGRSARDGGAGATYTFEDVHFDFNKSQLRKPDLDTLRSAVAALKADPTLVLNLEGYTCNVGTKEYNLALGDRRANAVKSYLVSEGIAADRLRTISYGEERPKYDNSKAATRRLNRRVAIVPAGTP